MRKHLNTLLVASTLTAGLAAAPAIYAHNFDGAGGSMMGRGMRAQSGTMEMRQMSGGMMEHCNEMMQAMRGDGHEPARPNEQWRDGQLAPEDLSQPQTPHR